MCGFSYDPVYDYLFYNLVLCFLQEMERRLVGKTFHFHFVCVCMSVCLYVCLSVYLCVCMCLCVCFIIVGINSILTYLINDIIPEENHLYSRLSSLGGKVYSRRTTA